MQEQLSSATTESTAVLDTVHVVSNREPYRHEFDGNNVVVDRPTGGLTKGLDPVMQRVGGTWTAWGDGEADFVVCDGDNCVEVPPDDPAYTLQRLPLTNAEIAGYYEGYANQTLWPLCHTAMGNVTFDDDYWAHYQNVNKKFAEVTATETDDETTVWLQDYHFALSPRYLREETTAFLMQFWHIPWPSVDVFRVAPNREALLDGLLANDLLGFHVPWYCANFLTCVEELLDDAVVDWSDECVYYGDHPTHIEAFPLGVDADAIESRAADPDSTGRTFRENHGIDSDRPIILGVDRLDYTKGIPERLAALEHLWETRPGLRGEFTYVQKGQKSREGIKAYRTLQEQVVAGIQRLNDRFGTADWQPAVLTTDYLPADQLYGLYRDAEAALVTPVRDGMNLVAKEYVSSQTDADGVLVLSSFAGARHELGEDALLVNPYETASCADAIERALTMDQAERRDRMVSMRETVTANGISEWIDSVFETASIVQSERQELPG